MDKGAGASRVMVLLEDKKQEKRAVGQGDLSHDSDAASKSTGNLTGYSGKISSTSLNELRRSAELLDVVKRVKQELERPTPSQSAIFDICLPSRLSGVVRFITGVLPTLDVADVFAVDLTHYRVRRLHADSMAGLCKHLWLRVFEDEIAEFPRVSESSFHPHFVKDLLLSNWTAIDFEQRLVFDLDLAKAGTSFTANFNRPRSQWYIDENTLTDLAAPITKIFMAIGYSSAMQENSAAVVIMQARDGFQHARRNPSTAASLTERAKAVMPNAMHDAQEAFSNFFSNTSAMAKFPASWLPLESTCMARLESSKKAAKVYNDWMADLSEVMEDSPLKQKAPAKVKENAKETEQLRRQIQAAKDEIKDLKEQGRSPTLYHTNMVVPMSMGDYEQ